MGIDKLPETEFWKALRFDQAGLIPAIIQERASGRILMMAYMNQQALELTVTTGTSHFWSRSRNMLWEKGRTSGHTQRVTAIRVDCDGDALLVEVDSEGPACHTGEDSCFFRRSTNNSWVREPMAVGQAILDRIYEVIRSRREHPQESSYVSSLFAGGLDRILKKVGEEAGEVLIASKNGERDQIVWETADLWFHTLVTLGYHDIPPRAVFDELERRVKGSPQPGDAP